MAYVPCDGDWEYVWPMNGMGFPVIQDYVVIPVIIVEVVSPKF